MLRRPIVSGLGIGALLGIAFVVLRIQGPTWFLAGLQLLVVVAPVAIVGLIAAWLAVRRGIGRARSVAFALGVWVGFVVGFFLFGITTCAFCLA